MQENTKTYKIFHEYFFHGKSAGRSVICESFSSLEEARRYAEEMMETHTVYLFIRAYSEPVSIIGGKWDNGKVMDIMHNCVAIRAFLGLDKTEKSLKDFLEKYGYSVVMADCIDMDCSYLGISGKEFAIIVGCENTKENHEKLHKTLIEHFDAYDIEGDNNMNKID